MNKQFKDQTIGLMYSLIHDYETIHKELTNTNINNIGNCIYWRYKDLAKDLSMFFSEQSKYVDSHFTLTGELNDTYTSEYCSLFESVGWYPFLYTERAEYHTRNDDSTMNIDHILIFKSKFDSARFLEWIKEEEADGVISKDDSEILKNEVIRVYNTNSNLNRNNLDYAYFEVLKYMIKFFS